MSRLTVELSQNNSNFVITWIPPSSLVLVLQTSPQISYCLSILNEVSGAAVFAECGRMDTSFTFLNYDCVTKYQAVVTPVNPVGNGISSSAVFPGLY